MPSGKTHDTITLAFLPIATSAAWGLTQSFDMALMVFSGVTLGGFLIGPDLDTRSVHYKRWGPLRFLWYPYQKLVRHRSVWSHGPIIGVLSRVVYFLTCLAIFIFLGQLAITVYSDGNVDWSALLTEWVALLSYVAWRVFVLNRDAWLAILVGLEVGASLHYSADWISTTWKRLVRSCR